MIQASVEIVTITFLALLVALAYGSGLYKKAPKE